MEMPTNGRFSWRYKFQRFPLPNARSFYNLKKNSCVNSAWRKFTETLLQGAWCAKRTIWFDTGHSCDINRWFDNECLQKSVKHAVHWIIFRRQHLMQMRQHIEKKRSEYKSTTSEEKKQYKIIHQALLDKRGNSNKFWKIVQNVRWKKRKQLEIAIKT